MKNKSNIKLPLTEMEKANLRRHKIKIANILDFASDELEVLLNATKERAKEIYALAAFQTVPTVGIKFAEDLVFLGYYSLNELKQKDGAKLTDEYEQRKGYWVDPCVEDQFRLVVNFANTNDTKKTWWDFTEERKKFRAENVYLKAIDKNTSTNNKLLIYKYSIINPLLYKLALHYLRKTRI